MSMTQASAEYFERVAGQWDSLRTGYFWEAVRGRGHRAGLSAARDGRGRRGFGHGVHGCGAGASGREVYAVDGSAAMLEVGRAQPRRLRQRRAAVGRWRGAAVRGCQPGRRLRQYVSASLPRSAGGYRGDGARAEAGRPAGDHRPGSARARVDASGNGRRLVGLRARRGEGLAAGGGPGERDRRLHRPNAAASGSETAPRPPRLRSASSWRRAAAA